MALNLQKITEQATIESLADSAHILITQDIDGTESVRRAPLSLFRDSELREEVDVIKESLGGAFGYAGTSWVQSGTHSSQLDWVHMECSAGDEVTVDVHTASGETGVSGTVVCATNNKATAVMTKPITTGTPITFELTGNAEDFSLYLSALSAQSTVYFSIRKGEAIMEQVDAMAAELAETRSEVADIKDMIGTFETAETSWSQSGSHSSQLDWLHLESKSGDEIKVNVHTDSGETGVYGRVVCATNNKATLVTQQTIYTGTPLTFTLPGDAEDFSLYLDALSSPSTVHFSVTRGTSISDKIDALEDAVEECKSKTVDVNETTFTMRAGQGHSNLVDTITLNIAKGERFELLIMTDNGEHVNGTFVCTRAAGGVDQYGLTTNYYDKYTAEYDYTQFGVYVAPMNADTKVTFRIIKQTSPYYKEDISDVDVWEPVITDTVAKLAAQQTYVNGLNFVFITDIHWERNWHSAPALINRICDRSRVRLVINCGDLATGDGDPFNGNGVWQAEWLYKATAEFNGDYDYYAVKGNHDTNLIGTWAEGVNHELTPAQIRQLMLPPSHKVRYPDLSPAGFATDDQDMLTLPEYATPAASTSTESVPCYYSFDAYNTTFICLDTDMVGTYDANQVAWAKKVIKDTNMPYVLIFMHIIWGGDGEDDGAQPCTMFNGLMIAINELTTAQKAKIQAIFTGHVHVDRNETINGIPIIATDTDSRYANDGHTRHKGTTSQQCFDVVTINYDAKKIYCNRVGTIGTDRVISYGEEAEG